MRDGRAVPRSRRKAPRGVRGEEELGQARLISAPLAANERIFFFRAHAMVNMEHRWQLKMRFRPRVMQLWRFKAELLWYLKCLTYASSRFRNTRLQLSSALI